VSAVVLVSGCGTVDESASRVTPSSGSGSSQVFNFTFRPRTGQARLLSASALINNVKDGHNACYVLYQGGTLALVYNSGVGARSLVPGTSASVENAQCRLDAKGSSAVDSGQNFTLTLQLTFKPSFSGRKQVFLASTYADGSVQELEPRGSWIVP
jgi:hypothetical protein